MTSLDPKTISDSRATLAGRVIHTPVLPLTGSKVAPYIPPDAELFIKLELFQHTGSFKARGASLGIDWLTAEQRRRGVAGFSGGNFALALAWAARQQNVPAKVVMAKTAEAEAQRASAREHMALNLTDADVRSKAKGFYSLHGHGKICSWTWQNLGVCVWTRLRRA